MITEQDALEDLIMMPIKDLIILKETIPFQIISMVECDLRDYTDALIQWYIESRTS